MAGTGSSDKEDLEDSDSDVSNLGVADTGEESFLSDLSLPDPPGLRESLQFLRNIAEGGSGRESN
jgi:hypothetical protein